MKRFLLLVVLMCTLWSGYSQSSIETALPLVEGENITYTDESSSNVSVYYKYTAPESQDKLITFTRADYSVYCDVTTDGSTYVSGVYLSNGYAYPVKGGETLYFKVYSYSGTSVTFGIAISDTDTDGGATCNDAIILTDKDTYIPSYYDMDTYSYHPTFATYTCNEDGILELNMSSSVNTIQVMDNCEDSTPTTLAASYNNGNYSSRVSVVAGNTYIFRMELNSSPILMSAKVTHPAPGTTAETAIELTEGKNSYTFEEATSGNNIVYYKYTAPATQGKLVQFSSTDQNVRSSMKDLAGSYISGIYSSDYTSTSYPVYPGQEVILEVGGYNITAVEFTIALIDANTDGGKTCDDAIAIGEGNTFVPCHKEGYSSIDTYLSYTCEESGLLEMTFTGSVSSCTAQIGCESTTGESVSVGYVNGKYIGKYEVVAGNTYIFRIQSYNPLFVSVSLSHPVKGLSCDMPFDGAATNILPKEAGSYWYKYYAETTGYMIISSECSLAGGSLSVWSDCNAYSANESIDGYFAMRTAVYTGNSYLINIEKTEATATEENFNIITEADKEGDLINNPIIIEAGQTVTTPLYNGKYYYRITVPEGANKFLIVDAQAAGITNAETGVSIYAEENSYSTLANGSNYAKAQVNGGENYIIEWTCREGLNSFAFTATFEDIQEGTTCDNAIDAIKGENTLPASSEYYYSYTATQTGWLVIDTDVTIGVTFLRGCNSWDGSYQATKIANINKCEMITGEKCIIKFTNIEDATTFFLSEESYQIGESCETAIDVLEGESDIPENAGKYWFKYVVDRDCKVTISANIAYESIYNETTYTSSYSSVRVLTDCNEYGTEIIQTNASTSYFEGSFVASKDDVLYIRVLTLTAQSDRKLTIKTADLLPGESCTTPIAITSGEVTLPAGASRNNPVWYSIDLEPGEFSIKSQSYNDYFSMSMYENCDSEYALATSTYTDECYILSYDVTTKGTYLLKLDAIYNEITVTVSGKYSGIEGVAQDTQVRVMGNNVVVTANNTRTNVVICDITGKVVASQAVYDQATFNLEQGIYIVKVGNQISKIAIR